MSNTVFQIKRSSVAGKLPVASDLVVGELAINLTDKVLYSKDGSGNIFAVSSGVGTSLDGLTDVVITSPSTGQVLKFNGTNWVNDTDASGSNTTLESILLTLYGMPTGDYGLLSDKAISDFGENLLVEYDLKATFPSGSGVLTTDFGAVA